MIGHHVNNFNCCDFSVKAMANIATSYEKLGRLAEATALLEQVVENNRALPEDHPFKGVLIFAFLHRSTILFS
jgi:hypothetical protein